MSTIDEVKSRLDIIDVITGYVPELKKAGRSFKARCPFHTERTPSFVADQERQTWHCFGACSTGGDVIEFVRRIEGLEFREALERCAERAGVTLRTPTAREQQAREQHERLLAANEAAAVFFQSQFRSPAGADARAYTESRGLDSEAIERWQLGYAPDGWSALSDHLVARGFHAADLVEAGLAIEGERGLYDRFRDRLVFPTRDQRRRLIGFGARALRPDDEPKYLNTPQTPLFDKSGTLYGLDRAADAIRRADQAVVVEGYMDVIAAHQFGLDHVVASNGTAITEKQMALLKRYSQNVVLALDADEAGSEAALRGVEVAAGVADHQVVATVDWRGLVSYQDVLQADIRVTTLPPGEDPDSLVRSDPDRFRAVVAEALPIADHLFTAVSSATDSNDARARSRALQALVPTVAAMADPVVRSHYVQKLARLGQVDESMVMRMLASHGGAPRARPVASPSEVQAATKQPAAPADGETQLLRLLLQRQEARGAGLVLDPAVFEDSVNHELFRAWCEDVDVAERLDDLDDALRERYETLTAVALPEFESRHIPEMVESMASELRLRRQQARLRSALREQGEAFQEQRRAHDGLLEVAVRFASAGVVPDEEVDDHTRAAAEFSSLTVERMRTAIRPMNAVSRRGPGSAAHGRQTPPADDPIREEQA